MERILVLSDSHGNVDNMIEAVNNTEPDRIIHLGDCFADARKLHKQFPEIPMAQVPGNCDWDDGPAEQILEVEGMKILICHGHTYNVKMSYLSLEMGALEQEADMALFGHTHQVFYDYHNGLRMMNPGSIGAPRWGNPPSYGIITVDGAKKDIDMEIEYIE